MINDFKNYEENLEVITVDKIIIKDGFVIIKNVTRLPFLFNDKFQNYTMCIAKGLQETLKDIIDCTLEKPTIQYKRRTYCGKEYYRLEGIIEIKEIYYYTDFILYDYTLNNNEINVDEIKCKIIGDKGIVKNPKIILSKKMQDVINDGYHTDETKFKCVVKKIIDEDEEENIVLLYDIYPKTF